MSAWQGSGVKLKKNGSIEGGTVIVWLAEPSAVEKLVHNLVHT